MEEDYTANAIAGRMRAELAMQRRNAELGGGAWSTNPYETYRRKSEQPAEGLKSKVGDGK